MNFSLFSLSNAQEVIALFSNVFSASEGGAEGQVKPLDKTIEY